MFQLSPKKQEKLFFWVSVVALAAVLIPLFAISFYNFRSVDDFPYIQNSGAIWQETHSLLGVLKGQFDYAYEVYFNWQGTFLAEWFVSTLIVLFSEHTYYVGTFLCLGGFVLAEGFLLMTLLTKGLGADRYGAATITCWCIILQVLLTPYPVEAFYWFCGAALYTFAHALALVLVSLLFLFCYEQTGYQKKTRTIWLQVGIILISVALGSGTYVTALTVFVLYLLLNAWLWYKKHPRKGYVMVDSLIYLAVFLSNVLAPGNLKRLGASGAEKSPVVKSIVKSLYCAMEYCLGNAILPVFLIALLFVPFLSKMVQIKRYRYPLPFLVSMVSFGVFAAQFVPCIYTLDIIGAGRIQNLYRFNFYLLFFGNELYWIGWLNRIRQESHEKSTQSDERGMRYFLPCCLLEIVLFGLSLISWGGSTITTVSAVESLRSGQAKQYYEEYRERLVLLEDENVKEVYLQPFTSPPYLLFFGDIQKDTQDWVNQSVALYYDKDIVGFLGEESLP